MSVRSRVPFGVAAVAAMAVVTAWTWERAPADNFARTPSRQPSSVVRPLLLSNGDRLLIRVGPDGHRMISVLPPAAGHDSVFSTHLGDRTEVIPADAPVAVTAAAPATPRRRHAATHTLTITGSDLSGQPDSGDVAWVVNAGDLAAAGQLGFYLGVFHHGVASLKVPSGRYWLIGEFTGSRSVGGFRLDVPPQVTVDKDTTVHLAARAASSRITMITPRAAVPVDVRFDMVIVDRHGHAQDMQWWSVPGSIWVSPMTRRPTVGALRASAFQQLLPPRRTRAIPYAYNLDVADPAGIIPAQRYHIQSDSLAAVTERYYQDVRSTGDWTAFGAFPDQGQMAFVLRPLALPGVQLQYFSTAPDLIWSSGYDAFAPPAQAGFPSGGQTDDTFRVLSPGPQIVDWNRYPLHPQPTVSANGTRESQIPLIPSAIRSGNELTLTVRPFSDNTPGHLSGGAVPGTTATVSYEIDQNGVRLASGSAAKGIPPVTLSAKPSTIRFSLDAARSGRHYRLSARTKTVWIWRSVRQPGATVPASWYCSELIVPHGYEFLRRCAVQPMMTLDYHVRGIALDGTTATGAQLVTLHAGHIQPAVASRITVAAAQVSCDDGKTWHRTAVHLVGGGNFRVTFAGPSGCAVTLRMSAADAAGDSIVETVHRAYQVATRRGEKRASARD